MTDKAIKRGLEKEDKGNGQDKSDNIDQKGFGEKLPDQLGLFGADDLPDANFPGPFDRPGGGKIDIIDPGDNDDKEGDDQQPPYDGRAARPADLVFKIRVEVGKPGDQRTDANSPGCSGKYRSPYKAYCRCP